MHVFFALTGVMLPLIFARFRNFQLLGCHVFTMADAMLTQLTQGVAHLVLARLNVNAGVIG